MSYCVYLAIDTGGPEPATVFEAGSYTYNVSPMFYLAFGKCGFGDGLRSIGGKVGREMVPVLESVSSFLRSPDNRERLKAMEPENGWGNLEGACRFVDEILKGCRLHPKAKILIT